MAASTRALPTPRPPSGSPEVRGFAGPRLLLRATDLAGLGREGWAEALEAVIAAAGEAGDTETKLSAANNLVTGHEMHGRPARAALATTMLERAGALRLGAWERQFAAMLANLDLHAGDLRGCWPVPGAPGRGPRSAGHAAGRPHRGPRAHRSRATRRPWRSSSAPRDGRRRRHRRGDVLFILAEAAFWRGRPAEALGHIDAISGLRDLPVPTSFLVDVTAAWAASRRRARSPPPLPMARPPGARGGRRGTDGDRGPRRRRPRPGGDRVRGRVGCLCRVHRRGQVRAGWGAAEARRLAGDEDGARAALEAIEGEAAEAGFVPLLGRIQRSLRLLGVRRAARTASVDRSSILTARERDLAELVGRGLTNPEIARRMGLGRPTVARLLSNAMLKVGVDSRAQLVARLEDRELV